MKIAFLIFLVFVYFTLRGPFRAVQDSGDFKLLYAGARAWIKGIDPYKPANFIKIAGEAGAGWLINDADSTTTRPVYPPTAFALLSPISLLPWLHAKIAWAIINVTLFILALLALSSFAELKTDNLRFFSVIAIAFAPIHTGISKGNPSVAAITLIVLAVTLNKGSILGIAFALKPQLAAPFIIYFILQRNWQQCGVCLASIVVITLIALLRLESGWLDSMLANIQILSGPGGINDPSRLNPYRHHLINLQYPLYEIGGNAIVVNTITGVVVLLLAIIYLVKARRRDALHRAAALVPLVLLPIYHRFYDAALLLLPLAMGITDKSRLTVILLLPFLIPGAVILHGMIDDVWWKTLVVPHQVWCIVALALIFSLKPDRPALPLDTQQPRAGTRR
jgi:Glycosyltransferase family 87